MNGYKSPIILSSISNPYFIHLNLYKKGKLLLQKTWVAFLISLLLILIILSVSLIPYKSYLIKRKFQKLKMISLII